MPERCAECGKIVYVTEKLVILNKIFHKSCFKCSTCGKVLTMKNYAAVGGKSYCQPHYPAPGKDKVDAPPPEAGSHYGDASRGATQLITTEVTPIDYSGGQNQEHQPTQQQKAPTSRTQAPPQHVEEHQQEHEQEHDQQGYEQQGHTEDPNSASTGGYDPNYDYGNY